MQILKSQKGTPSRLVQRRLQISLILTLLLVTSVIIVTALVKASYVRHEAFSALIAQSTGQARTTLLEFFEPVASNLRLLRRWGMNSDLSNLNAEIMARQFIPIMEEFPQLWAAILADEAGREFFVYRDGDEWLVRTMDASRRPGEADWERWQGPASATETWSDKLTYDPRSRPWFQGATAVEYFDKVFWTPPYTFATAQEPGVTAAISFSAAEEPPKTYVLAFDILMTQVMEFMDSIPVSEHGKAFLFDGQGSLFGAKNSNSDNTPLTAAIGEALAKWRVNPALRDKVSEFKSGAQVYWAGFQPVELEEGRVWIGVVIPKQDMQQEIASRQNWLWGVAGIALLIGAVLATLIARYFGRQLRSLERRQLPQGRTEKDIKTLIAQGESDRLEFKSTLRFNLKAERVGKEIELAWLKGVVAFLNTEGGKVLIGVADDGSIIGLTHDNFDNEDKCLLHFINLINQHIGHEFSRYLSASICSIEGKRILLIDCEPAAEPTFLKVKQDEEFYVRTGPRNAKLPVSKALSYVQSRQRTN